MAKLDMPVVKSFGFACSLRTGTKLFGWFFLMSAIWYLLEEISILFYLHSDHFSQVNFWMIFIEVAVSFVLLLGAYEERPGYILVCGMILTINVLFSFCISPVIAGIHPFQLSLYFYAMLLFYLYGVLVILSYYHELTTDVAVRSMEGPH